MERPVFSAKRFVVIAFLPTERSRKMQLVNIKKTYDGKNYVIKNISYKFEKGKIYVLKGVSGCGKTTLLNIMGGLDSDFEGELTEKPDRTGFVTQNNMLFLDWTVYENLAFINSDSEYIEENARLLGIEHLLNSTPDKLSGGERQRVCVIRALSGHPDLIIADEPAASLDGKNAKNLALTFEKIRSKDNIIIIATHKSSFDGIADEIIHLDYGIVGEVEKNDRPENRKSEVAPTRRVKNTFFGDIAALLKKNRKSFKLGRILPIAFLVTAVLCAVSLYGNIEYEVMKAVTRDEPCNVISTFGQAADYIIENYDVSVYEEYVINTDSFDFMGLFYEEDSGFSYGNTIICGCFPDNTQVLADTNYVEKILGESDYTKALGQKVSIEGREFEISGVVPSLHGTHGEEEHCINCNGYYQDKRELQVFVDLPPRIYMPYDTISLLTEPKNNNGSVNISVKGLFDPENPLYLEIEKNVPDSFTSYLYNKVKEARIVTKSVLRIAALCAVLFGFIALIFVSNDVRVSYYYRRKEIGALRLFGVSKRRVLLFLLSERLISCVLAFLISLALFTAVCAILYFSKGMSFFVNPLQSFAVFAVFAVYCMLTVIFAARKMLKSDILQLIK